MWAMPWLPPTCPTRPAGYEACLFGFKHVIPHVDPRANCIDTNIQKMDKNGRTKIQKHDADWQSWVGGATVPMTDAEVESLKISCAEPYFVEDDIFRPMDQLKAKKAFRLVVLLGCTCCNMCRKCSVASGGHLEVHAGFSCLQHLGCICWTWGKCHEFFDSGVESPWILDVLWLTGCDSFQPTFKNS